MPCRFSQCPTSRSQSVTFRALMSLPVASLLLLLVAWKCGPRWRQWYVHTLHALATAENDSCHDIWCTHHRHTDDAFCVIDVTVAFTSPNALPRYLPTISAVAKYRFRASLAGHTRLITQNARSSVLFCVGHFASVSKCHRLCRTDVRRHTYRVGQESGATDSRP